MSILFIRSDLLDKEEILEVNMAEQFLTLMADFDDKSQEIMSEWYNRLKETGYVGVQTKGIPYHISMGMFSLEKEQDVIKEMKRLADENDPIDVSISHIGIFTGGKVLFCGIDMNPAGLLDLRNSIAIETDDEYPWSPHATILLDEPETICEALPQFIDSFRPFKGKITRLHLCAFWPTREIATIELRKNKSLM